MSTPNHKYTAKCTKCKYTSRIPVTSFYLTNKNSCHSQICPIHRLPLVRLSTRISKTNK